MGIEILMTLATTGAVLIVKSINAIRNFSFIRPLKFGRLLNHLFLQNLTFHD